MPSGSFTQFFKKCGRNHSFYELIMAETLLKCENCHWIGTKAEVGWDSVETCMGNDQIEVCPQCGSMEVYPVRESS